MRVRLAAGLLMVWTLVSAGCCCHRDACARPLTAARPCCPVTSYAAPPLRTAPAPVIANVPPTNGCCH